MALPTHHEQPTKNYTIQSSDVLDDLRICVCEEGSDKVRWYKERFLSEREIVENVVDSFMSTVCWTIHRPKRGWYIRIRAPTFPPGVFIPLMPVPLSSPSFVQAALTLSCQTPSKSIGAVPPSPPPKSMTVGRRVSSGLEGSEPVVNHSYPPTPPVVPSSPKGPPSPRGIHDRLEKLRTADMQGTSPTEFILTPHTPSPSYSSSSLFTRAMSMFQPKQADSSSFTLRLNSKEQPLLMSTLARPESPQKTILTYHDTTPMWTLNAKSGLLQVDCAAEVEWGLPHSFWVAVSLAYLEFLEDRDSYLAALES